MNRREFLKYSALVTAASSFPALTRCGNDTTQPAGQDGDALLTNAAIIDVRTGRVREENQILIKDGKILDLFTGNETRIHTDCVLDLKGAYVTPGLINAHCHMSMACTISNLGSESLRLVLRQIDRNAEECIRHGVTTVRDMAAFSDWLYGLKRKIAQGDIAGPRILTSYVLDVWGGYLGTALGLIGDQRFWKMVNTPQQGVEGVQAAVAAGADLIKIVHQAESLVTPLPNPRQMGLEITKAICEKAFRHGLVVALHHTDTQGLDKGLTAGVTSFEHLSCDRHLTGEEIARILDRDVYFVPTASVGYACSYETNRDPEWHEGFKALVKEARMTLLPGMLSEYCEPEVAKATLETFEQYCDPDYFDTSHLFSLNVDAFRTVLTTGFSNVMALYDAGAQFGCGNDGGVPFDFPGAMGLEMYLLERAGMDTADILRMATINNAQLLGMENEIGTIEKGKIADLVVFRDNPLDTFKNAFNPSMVFQIGQLVFSS